MTDYKKAYINEMKRQVFVNALCAVAMFGVGVASLFVLDDGEAALVAAVGFGGSTLSALAAKTYSGIVKRASQDS